jgi:ubiquitin carboxyl-terminal hydrolase 4/11/15
MSRFDKPETSEEDEVDSGEGQGLGANSSLRGSPSALTGVGAALHQASGSGATGQMTTVNPQDLDQLPAYQAHENEDDAAPLLQRDAEMNEGLGLQNSIEDEGIDMSMGYNNLNYVKESYPFTGTNQSVDGGYTKDVIPFTPINQSVDRGFNATNFSNWNFNNLNGLSELENNNRSNYVSGTGSEIDLNDNSFDLDGSDVVQHDSSASEGSLLARLDDFDRADPIGDDGDPFEDPSPVPDVEDEDQLDTLELHRELIRTHNRPPPEFQVHAADQEEEIEEPATEIHIEDGEELKMD